MSRFFFDHNSTTPVSAEVLAAYLPALQNAYGNASSIHQSGQKARQLLESARRQVAGLLHESRERPADAKQIVFTSGGTESNNMAVFGLVHATAGSRKHVVTSAIEHPAVLQACWQLEREGVEVSYVRPDAHGVVQAEAIAEALQPHTVLVALMHVNNETGVVQPIGEVARVARERGIAVHCDGVQAVGKLPLQLDELGVATYAISGHKLYAPKGVGALYVRAGIVLQPLVYGGRQEQGRRAGTENVAGAVALGAACEWMKRHGEAERLRLCGLRDELEARLRASVAGLTIAGMGAPRVVNTSNVMLPDRDGEATLIALDLAGFAVSTGSACASGAIEPSHVLLAMGLAREQARRCLRLSLGRENDRSQVEALAGAIGSLMRTRPMRQAEVLSV